MFDLAWSEIALIGVVALVVIGPKDLPGAIRGVAQMLGKARRMAGEFQTHVDEMVREAKLDEVKREIDSFRNTVQNEVYKAANVEELKRDIVDPLKDTMRDVQTGFTQAGADVKAAMGDAPPAAPPAATSAEPAPATPVSEPPAMIPPAPDPAPAAVVAAPVAPPPDEAPAFVPPGTSRA